MRPTRILLAAVVIPLALGASHGAILTAVASFMAVRDAPQRADLILPFPCAECLIAAAELYRSGYARRIGVWSGAPSRLERLGITPSPLHVRRRALESEGVAAEAIVNFGQDIDNVDELASALARHLGARRRTRVIVVAPAPWARLTRHDLGRALPAPVIELRMFPAFPATFNERSWWHSGKGWIAYFDAYYLWLVRLLR